MATRIANTAASILNQTVLTAAEAQAITGLKTFNRAPAAPFAVQAASAKVTNLDADLLDGQEGTYYSNVANLTGTTLPAAIVTSSLTAVGTITTGVWNAGAVTTSGAFTGVTAVLTRTTDGNVVDILNTNGSLSAEVFTIHASRAASGAYVFVNLYANSVSQVSILGNGAITTKGQVTIGSAGQIILNATASASIVSISGGAMGTGNVTGAVVGIGRNTSGSGAAGTLELDGSGGASNYIWADASASPGVLRISTAPPQEDGTPSDTSGTVVGSQASWHEFKTNIVPTTVTPDEALRTIVDTPIYDFEYPGGGLRDGDDNPIVFTGFVGYNRNDWFLTNAGKGQNPALDEVTIPGYYALAFKALASRVAALEAQIANRN